MVLISSFRPWRNASKEKERDNLRRFVAVFAICGVIASSCDGKRDCEVSGVWFETRIGDGGGEGESDEMMETSKPFLIGLNWGESAYFKIRLLEGEFDIYLDKTHILQILTQQLRVLARLDTIQLRFHLTGKLDPLDLLAHQWHQRRQWSCRWLARTCSSSAFFNWKLSSGSLFSAGNGKSATS